MVDLIPRDVLFGNPERLAPAVSPDGRRLAHIAPVDGVLNVWVGTLGGDDARPVSSDRERGVRSFLWCEDNRHIVYPQDAGGDENWHLRAVDLEDGGDVDLTPFPEVQARVLGHDRRRPHHLLVGLNHENPQLHDAYLLDVRDGTLELVAKNPGFVGWLVDSELHVRGGIVFNADGSAEIRVGDPATGEYRTLVEVAAEDALVLDVAGFTADGTALYLVTSKDANAARLLRMDVATGAAEVLAQDEVYDVDDVEIDPATQAVQVVGFMRDRVEHVVLDAALGPMSPRCAPCTRATCASTARPRRPHLGDRLHRRRPARSPTTPTTGSAGGHVPLRAQPDLAALRLAAMEPFAFTARDGLEVHGYLTFPPGSDPAGADRALRPRRPVGARHVGFRPTRSGSPTAATCASR